MKIGFVWDGNYPWDIRVEKICKSLFENGHEVHIICRNTKYQPKREIYEGIQIHRLPVMNSCKLLTEMTNFPFFFNPVWFYNIVNVFKEEGIEIAIVRDITLSLTTLKAAKKFDIPVILDMAEPYPEMIRAQHAYENLGFIKKVIRNVKFSEWVERKTLENVASIWAMVEESQDRLVLLKVPKEKIHIVSNTPKLQDFEKVMPSFPGSMEGLKDRINFLYIGFINFYRGLQIAIQSLPQILKHDERVTFVIVGSGNAEKYLKKLSRTLDVENHVYFEGYKHHSLIPNYIASCDVGIIPHISCNLWHYTIPNKLFDYMCMGIPVLSSDAKPTKRIIEEEQCGLIYSSNNPKEFAAQAIKLLDGKIRKQMGENGINAVKRRYNWSFDEAVMLKNIGLIYPRTG